MLIHTLSHSKQGGTEFSGFMLLNLHKLLTSNKLFLCTNGDYQLTTWVQQRLLKCVLNSFETSKILLMPEEILVFSCCSQLLHTLSICFSTWWNEFNPIQFEIAALVKKVNSSIAEHTSGELLWSLKQNLQGKAARKENGEFSQSSWSKINKEPSRTIMI